MFLGVLTSYRVHLSFGVWTFGAADKTPMEAPVEQVSG